MAFIGAFPSLGTVSNVVEHSVADGWDSSPDEYGLQSAALAHELRHKLLSRASLAPCLSSGQSHSGVAVSLVP